MARPSCPLDFNTERASECTRHPTIIRWVLNITTVMTMMMMMSTYVKVDGIRGSVVATKPQNGKPEEFPDRCCTVM
jgi:hypothetical protein